jgi:hypothetical protein
MTAGKIYIWELMLIYSSPVGAGTPDFKVDFSGPATMFGNYSFPLYIGLLGQLNSVVGQSALTSVSALGTDTIPHALWFQGQASSTGGGTGSSGFVVRWAQNTSSSDLTRRHAGSVLRWRQLSV